ncbi:MAG TPA: citrate synthase [Steroidobacteraceae bacterium]|nr:citrate synthase [Steroidobacteraceae bacterium]
MSINVRHAMGWMTASQALRTLEVRPQTLYANVSRKRIRAKADPKDPRRSLYHEGDVRRLARKRGGARKAEEVAAAAIEWGTPVLASAVSTVAGGRLWYRGEDAVLLAEAKTLEEIAVLLWGVSDPQSLQRNSSAAEAASRRPRDTARPSSSELSRVFLELARRVNEDPPSHGRTLAVLQAEAAEVLATVADAMLGSSAAAALHQRLAKVWGRADASDLIRRSLVLLADHELNASTFATRVTVSTGASLAAGVLGGLATLTGPLHGGAAAGVRELMDAASSQGAEAAIRDRLAQGRPMAGFGHPLYPAGDPRAAALLQRLQIPPGLAEIRDLVEDLVGERPNIDFALAALTETCRLPRQAPLVLFALARSVGWLAHALEQVTTGRLIRPRARYVGPAPRL